MKKKVLLAVLMLVVISLVVYAQTDEQQELTETPVQNAPIAQNEKPEPKEAWKPFSFSLKGEMSGMLTYGLQDENQVANNMGMEPPGVYFPNLQTGSGAAVGTGKNGYYNNFDLILFLSPVSSVELYAKFKTRYQTGSPYIPLQLDSASKEDYSVKTDAAWARGNATKGLGLNTGLDLWFKLGKFKAEAAHFNKITLFGVENVLDPLQTGTNHAFQIEAGYPIPSIGPMTFSFTVPLKLNEAIKEYYDEDSEASIISHYHESGRFALLPMHMNLRMYEIDLPFAVLQAELLYTLNGLHIWSGHSIGAGMAAKIPVTENLVIPIGLGAAFFEKNIDAFTSTSKENSEYESFYGYNGYSKADSYTLGLRQALRIGIGVGAEINLNNLKTELNFGFTYSQIAHIYRDTLTLFSMSVDVKTIYMNNFIFGAGIYLGSLNNAEWNVKEGINRRRPGETTDRELFEGHIFSLSENMGFEIYTGLLLQNMKFILGWNTNKGISMNKYLEALPDAQQKYRQAGTGYSDGYFERGGIFAKLVINL